MKRLCAGEQECVPAPRCSFFAAIQTKPGSEAGTGFVLRDGISGESRVLLLHIAKRLAVFAGRKPDIFAEHGVQMADRAEAEHICDISDGNRCIHQQALCFTDAPAHDILHGRNAELILKDMREIIFIYIQLMCDCRQRE